MKNRRQKLDRISALPEDIIAKILTHMPIRDALRTNILSKRWRYCWTRMPKLVFDDELVKGSSDSYEIKKYKLVNAIFHVLLLHRAPILEFSLVVVVDVDIFSEIDQIILYLSRSNNIKKFILDRKSYVLPCSIFKLQGLEHLHLKACELELPSMNKGFSMLKTLCFENMYIPAKLLQGFLANCPLLEEFTWLDDADDIVFTESEFVELVKCLPLVQFLFISDFCIEHTNAGAMPHKLPTSLAHLRVVDVGVHFNKLSSVLLVISISPNLEKIKLYIWGEFDEEDSPQTSNNLLDMQAYMGLNFNHLKELEITQFHNYASEMEFLKIIMANSPVLKKARIELDSYVSVHEENKMLRDLLNVPFPRASPTTNFIIERR